MPLKKDRCECGELASLCPECGGNMVTPQERHGHPSANEVVNFNEEGEFEWKHVCWECGWTEIVTAEITREVTG